MATSPGFITSIAIILIVCGCTRAELESKAEAYNEAIAESTNRQILLNAVRASQRAPMSFVSFGEVSANPNYSASTAATFNFDRLGLTTYSLNPALNINGGFTTFGMGNLNNSEFMYALQKPLPETVVQHFSDLKFPKELVDLVFVQSYVLRRTQFERISHEVEAKCNTQFDVRTKEICQRLSDDRSAFRMAACYEFQEIGETITVLNTGRELCSMITFQTFIRKLRLLNMSLPFRPRTAQGILYFLGELIAAQNYSVKPYIPTIYVEGPDGHRHLVPLFVVRRGVPAPGTEAVMVFYRGEPFYIPRPLLGDINEARSMQVLDLVSQAIAAATAKGDLPRTSTITLVAPR